MADIADDFPFAAAPSRAALLAQRSSYLVITPSGLIVVCMFVYDGKK